MLLLSNSKDIMRKLLFIILMPLISFLLTGCFDVIEDITLHPDGSGKVQMTLNLSKSKTKVASIMTLDSINGYKIPKEKTIRKEVQEVVSTLRNTKGISNVSSSLDFNNYIAVIRCDFSQISSLNTFISTLSKQFKTNLSGYTHFAFQSPYKKFTRKFTYDPTTKKAYDKLNSNTKQVFNDAYYTSIYRFQNPVRSAANKASKISANKKAVMTRVGILQLISNQISLANKITID